MSECRMYGVLHERKGFGECHKPNQQALRYIPIRILLCEVAKIGLSSVLPIPSLKVCKLFFSFILCISIFVYILPTFKLVYFLFISIFCFFHCHWSQEKYNGLCWWHGCSHIDSPFILSVESFNPVRRVYTPLHFFWHLSVPTGGE